MLARRRLAGPTIGLLLAGLAAIAPGLSPAGAAVTPSNGPLTGYPAEPTEQLALPGATASGELTPEGDVYTGWAEYEPAAGPALRGWDQPTRVMTDPAVPLLRSQLARGGITYVERVFTIPLAGMPVTFLGLTAENPGPRPRTAQVALRVADTRRRPVLGFHAIPTRVFRYERPAAPSGEGFFLQLGSTFNPSWRYRVLRGAVERDGLLLAQSSGRLRGRAMRPLTPTAIGAVQTGRMWLRPGMSATWTWRIPLVPPGTEDAAAASGLRAVSLDAAEHRLAAYWRRQEHGMTRISLPESRVSAVYDASLVAILQARYRGVAGWVQAVNRLQYQAYWIRDSAAETVALDQAGLSAPAAANLAYLARWQQPDGEFISRSGQQDGDGQAIWELDEHAQLGAGSPAGAAAFAAAWLPAVSRAVDWIAALSTSDPLGLLGPSTIVDDEQLTGAHITGDDAWAAVGLRSAIDLARLAGRPDLAAAWRRLDARFEGALRTASRAALARSGYVTPALDPSLAGAGHDWGNFNLAYPLPILAPRSAAVLATMRHARAESREGLATYGGLLHDYLGFPIDETELAGGDVRAALRGLYAELAHTTAPGFGWEDGPRPFGTRTMALNLAPHGTFAANYVSLVRNLLVRDAGDHVDLFAGASPAWLAPGDVIALRGSPSFAGRVSVRLVVARASSGSGPSSGSGAGSGERVTLRWRVVDPSRPVFWVLPYWTTGARTANGRVLRRRVRLRGSGGTLSVTLLGHRPSGPSAAGTVAALDRAYRVRGRPAPIVPAPDW